MEKNTTKKLVSEIFTPHSIGELKELYHELQVIMCYYKCAMHEIEAKFKVLNEEFSLMHERNPIESIKTRLKTIESIREKLERRNLPLTVDSIVENLNDVAGIRVICSFSEDIYMLADCLTSQDDVDLIEAKDYIKNPKENGYRSLHLIVEIPIFLCNEKRFVRAEVQLRTITMESWAKLEHRLVYKKKLDDDVFEKASSELLECAHMSRELDRKMQAIRDIIEV